MTTVWTVKTQRKRISSHLKNKSPTKPNQYKLVCEQNVFCYRDFRSYPKCFQLLLKVLKHLKWIEWCSSLLHCLLLPSPSFHVEFQVGVLAPEDFSVSNLPLRGFTASCWIRHSCVCRSAPFACEIAWDSPIVNIVSQIMDKQVSSSWILWSLMGNHFPSNYCTCMTS